MNLVLAAEDAIRLEGGPGALETVVRSNARRG